MSWVTLSNKKVKIKKEHRCYGCTTKYPVGTSMQKTVCVDEGNFSSTYWCLICEAFLSDKWKDCEDGIARGECWEYPDYKEFRQKLIEKEEL